MKLQSSVVALSLAAWAVIAAPASPSMAAEIAMTPIRQVGGSGHAELYGWGLATATDGSILVGDYWNFQIKRYATDGTSLGTLIDNQGPGLTQHQSPYGIAVDPRNGDIVFGDVDGMQLPGSSVAFGNGVDKYGADGTYITSWGTKKAPGGSDVGTFAYPSYVAIASNGNVYVTDQWGQNVVAHDPNGTELFQIGLNTPGSGPGEFRQPRGIAFDGDDRLFVADNYNRRIQVFDADGTYLYHFGEPGTGPGQFGADMRGLAVDHESGWLYVVETSQAMVSKFDLDGNFLMRWGGYGNTPGKFVSGGRGVTVDHDGNVWVGDMGGFRVQKFDSEGNFLLQVPSGPTAPPDGGFNQPRGVAVGPDGEIFVTDTHNWRVQRFDADGSFETAFGTRGSDEYKFNYQRGIAVDPNDGAIIVADTDNHLVKRYTNDGVFVWARGGFGAGVGEFKNPHSVDVGSDGTIYVADTQNQRVVMLDSAGNVLGSFGSKGNGQGQHQFVRGVDHDDTDGTIWVTDSIRGRVNQWTTDGTWLRSFGSAGSADDQLLRAADVESDAQYVYVADADANAIKVWRKDGTFVGAFNGGPGPTQLQRPHGLDLVGDRLFVVEQTGERVQEFLITSGIEPDTTAPDAVVFEPAAGSNLPPATISLNGEATDDVGIASVRIAIKNVTSGLWWTGSGWGAFTHLLADLANPGAPTTGWSLAWDPPGDGEYGLLVDTRDTSSNPDPTKPWVRFRVVTGTVDLVEPDATLDAPVNGAVYPLAPLIMSGTATDDSSGVTAVDLGIKDTDSGLWWDGATWTPNFVVLGAELSAQNSTATDWTLTWIPPKAGSFGVLVRATDASGNVDPAKPWHGFAIAAENSDTEPPTVAISNPVKGASLPFGTVEITGTATDDTAVVAVDMAIKNTVSGQWWTGTAWGSFTYLPTAVSDSNPAEWSSTWTPPSPGSYGVMARAIDAAGNVTQVKPWHGFMLTGE